MEDLILVSGTLAAMALGIFAFRALHSDEAYSRKLVKIRVPVDERSRKRVDETPGDDYEAKVLWIWLAFATSVIFLFILLQTL